MNTLTSLFAATALQLGLLGATHAAPGNAPQIAPQIAPISVGSHVSLGPLKHIKAGLLEVAYAEVGPADGPVVILLHGWPSSYLEWSKVIDPLVNNVDKPFHVVAPDLPHRHQGPGIPA